MKNSRPLDAGPPGQKTGATVSVDDSSCPLVGDTRKSNGFLDACMMRFPL